MTKYKEKNGVTGELVDFTQQGYNIPPHCVCDFSRFKIVNDLQPVANLIRLIHRQINNLIYANGY